MQSSAKVQAEGATLSTPKFEVRDWLDVDVPTTVVAALVKHKIYNDPDFGMNLRSFPGVTYDIGMNFAEYPMAADSPFNVPWWYRKEFVLPASLKGRSIWLNFDGINYRANIWLNGKLLANSNDVVGAWRTYQFDITGAVAAGKNVLAIEVHAPTENDLGITFVDWNPQPPDKNMGLWKGVEITSSGPVRLEYPAVLSKVDSPRKSSCPSYGGGSADQSNAKPSERPVSRPHRKIRFLAGSGTGRGRIQGRSFHAARISRA